MSHTTSTSELLIRQRLSALTRALPGAQLGDATQLHHARVATRRLREALPLVAPGPRGRKLERRVRRLTRALGPVRELDVALLTLDELAASGDASPAALGRLRQSVKQERHLMHQEMLRGLERVNLDKLRKRAYAAVRKHRGASGSRHSRDPRRLEVAMLRSARRAARLKAAMENAAGLYLPDRLHEVRIAVKKLRYSIELANALSGSRAQSRLRTLKEAQDLLGRMHDLEVLIARIRGLQGSAGAASLRLSGELDRLVRRLETECRQLHGQYVASRRRLVTICEQAIDTAASTSPGASAA